MKKLKKKNKIIFSLSVKECQTLLSKAEEALVNTFPYSNQGFACAVMTSKGSIYTGASYGSDTWTLTMHSEAVALAHAAQHGETEIVAITGPNCHICKQLIYESSLRTGIDIVIVLEKSEEIKQIPITELMPYPWPEKPFI